MLGWGKEILVMKPLIDRQVRKARGNWASDA